MGAMRLNLHCKTTPCVMAAAMVLVIALSSSPWVMAAESKPSIWRDADGNLYIDSLPDQSVIINGEDVLATTSTLRENILEGMAAFEALNATLQSFIASNQEEESVDCCLAAEPKATVSFSGIVYSVAYSPDGNYIAYSGETSSKTIFVVDASTGDTHKQLTSTVSTIRCVGFSPDGNYLVSGDDGNNVNIWDLSGGTITKTFSGKHTGAIYSVAYSPDGTYIASSARDDNTGIAIWSISSGFIVGIPTSGHGYPYTITYSPDGQHIAAAHNGGFVRIYNALTGEVIGSINAHQSRVAWTVAYSPDGKYIVSGGDDKLVKIWEASTGAEIHSLAGHTSSVYSAAFSPDGKYVATGAADPDNTVKIWDTSSGEEINILTGHAQVVYGIDFSPDGKNIVTGSWDGTIRIWE